MKRATGVSLRHFLFIKRVNGILEMLHFDRSLLDTVGGRLVIPWGISGQSRI